MTNTSITKKVEDIPVSERIIAATGLGDADDRKDGTGEQREDVTTQVSGKRERIQEEVGGKAIKRTKIEEAKERIANGNGCHQTNGTQSSVEVAYKAASKAHVKKKIFMPCCKSCPVGHLCYPVISLTFALPFIKLSQNLPLPVKAQWPAIQPSPQHFPIPYPPPQYRQSMLKSSRSSRRSS